MDVSNSDKTTPGPAARLAVLDALRGVAALWVGLFHFTANGRFNGGFPADMPLKGLGAQGWLGVYVFFVISGFILPWTMDRCGYRLKDYGQFLWKRVLRLHPLYLVSVAAMLVPFGIGQGGGMAAGTWREWWPHLLYLNGLLGRPWLMEIYWTLALEAQFYLAVGLLFPLLAHRLAWVRGSLVLSLMLLPLGGWGARTGLPYAALFGMGMVLFLVLSGRLRRSLGVAGLLLGAEVTRRALGPEQGLTALVAAGMILAQPPGHRWLTWLGAVSYPFYLFHLIVAGLAMPWLMQWPRRASSDALAVLGLMALSLLVSWGLHRWVELPMQRRSSAVRYRRMVPPEK